MRSAEKEKDVYALASFYELVVWKIYKKKGECVCCVKPIEHCFQRRIIRSNATVTGLFVFIVGDAHNISGFVHAMPPCIPVFSLQSILSHPHVFFCFRPPS